MREVWRGIDRDWTQKYNHEVAMCSIQVKLYSCECESPALSCPFSHHGERIQQKCKDHLRGYFFFGYRKGHLFLPKIYGTGTNGKTAYQR